MFFKTSLKNRIISLGQTTPSKQRSGVNRRASQNKRSGSARATIALTQYDMRERQLAERSDKIIMSGKTITGITAVGTSPVVGTLPLNPASFGNRIQVCGLIFARFRITKLIVVANPGGTLAAFGVVDDYTAEGGSAPLPVTLEEVAEVRCSKTSLSTVNPNELIWKPVDPMKWYYTTNGNAASDGRFQYPASLAAGFTAAGSNSFTVYYTLEFCGGYDNTA